MSRSNSNQTVESGGTVTFTIYVTNTGDFPLSPITVTDVLAPNCNHAFGSLGMGAVHTYTCTITNVTAGFTNVAVVTGTTGGRAVTATDSAKVTMGNPTGDVYLPLVLKNH